MGRLFDLVPWHASEPVLRLRDKVARDDRDNRLDLSHSWFLDDKRRSPSGDGAKEAVSALWATPRTPRAADVDPGKPLVQLLFGEETEDQSRLVYQTTPDGTSADRMVLETLLIQHPETTIWTTDAHTALRTRMARSLGLNVRGFPFADLSTGQIALDAVLGALDAAAPGDVVALPACAHTPSGLTLNAAAWQAILGLCLDRGAVPWLHTTHFGLCQGLEEDRHGLSLVQKKIPEAIWTIDWAPTFGLVYDGLGMVCLQTTSARETAKVADMLRARAQRHYGTATPHGAHVVGKLLGDTDYIAAWKLDLRKRQHTAERMRPILADALKAIDPAMVPAVLSKGAGPFMTLALDPDQSERLARVHGIHLGYDSRLNLWALPEDRVADLAQAVRAIHEGADLPEPEDEFAHTVESEDWSDEIVLSFPRAAAARLRDRLDAEEETQALHDAPPLSDEAEAWDASEDQDGAASA